METAKKKKYTASDKAILGIGYVLLGAFVLSILIPLLYVVIASFMDPNVLNSQGISLDIRKWTVDAYRRVLENNMIWRGFANSFFYSVVFTIISVLVTLLAAYPMSKKEFVGRNFFNVIFLITMFFGGGMIPTYLVVKNMQLLNTIWALVLPGCLSDYNMIVARTFFKSNISEELYEAGEIDGCTQSRFFFQIALPLSKAIIAIMVLYYGVGHWNSYFSALLYISDQDKYPLQLVLRNILITNQTALSQTATTAAARAALQEQQQLIDVMKYSLIIISSVPVLIMYPLVQKHFVKGVMIGSVKG